MKIKDGFVLRKIADVHVVVPAGDVGVDFNGIITLNETAAFLFGQLQKETSKGALLMQLLTEYDVDNETAMADVEAFCSQLEEANLIA